MASYDEKDIVAAYIDGELRGFSNLDMFVAGQQLAFLSVFYHNEDGNDETNKKVTFKVWDASTGTMRAGVEPHWPEIGNQHISNLNPSRGKSIRALAVECH